MFNLFDGEQLIRPGINVIPAVAADAEKMKSRLDKDFMIMVY